MEPSVLPTTKKPNAKKIKISSLSDAIIISAFVIIVTSIVFNWMSDYVNPPDPPESPNPLTTDEWDAWNTALDDHQDALDDHQEKIRAYEGIYSLFSSIGVVMLVAGLFYKTVNNSDHLPDWVRVAMMVGVLYFMIRVFTSEISLMEYVELIALIGN